MQGCFTVNSVRTHVRLDRDIHQQFSGIQHRGIFLATLHTLLCSAEKTGFYIAEHSDVMIGVWDGLPSQGRGGTAEVVALARTLGKPICHIWAGNYKKDPDKRTDVGQKHGTVEYINFG
jgi:hypothetical protein